MDIFKGGKPCITICTPMPIVDKVINDQTYRVHDTISPLWMRARNGLTFPTNINYNEIFADGMEVGVARSRAAALALEKGSAFVFFLDYDVLPAYDAVTKLFYRARCYPDIDVFAGVYTVKRSNPPDPLIYTENGQGAFWDFAVGDLLTTEQHNIRATHMGLTLIRTDLFRRMKAAGLVGGDGTEQDNEPFFKTEKNERVHVDGASYLQLGTEDIYFYTKARQARCQIMVDTSVLAGHLDKETGVIYGLPNDFNGRNPITRAKWMKRPDGVTEDRTDGEEIDCSNCGGAGHVMPGAILPAGGFDCSCPTCGGKGKVVVPLKIAIDLGAGGERRQWPGHITYTLDARAEAKPDYVQDLLWLNLPDNHFDLVASSHSFEHVGRWDQEKVWSEAFRVCKPGGALEVIVPDVSWAAAKIHEGRVDEHVMNVLYGAQEAHGYKREFNLHYFGYTPEIGRALAENAGFVEVTVENWRTNPELGYNLIIRGKKPDTKE